MCVSVCVQVNSSILQTFQSAQMCVIAWRGRDRNGGGGREGGVGGGRGEGGGGGRGGKGGNGGRGGGG